MKTMTKTPVCVTGNVVLFNNVIEEIAKLQCELSNLCLPSPIAVEDGFDEDLFTDFGNAVRSLEEAYNALIIFARCKAFSLVPKDGMPATANDCKSSL